MARVKKTPPMYARGRYVLNAPWADDIVNTKLYTCIAIRSLKDIYDDGLDPYKEFYLPNGLVDGVVFGLETFLFQEEKDLLANIITLQRDDNEQTIYVPDTFIASFPSMGDVKYSQTIISMDFGAIPDYLDLGVLGTELANKAGKTIGKIPAFKIHRAPSANVPSNVQHEALEAARVGAIANQESDYAKAKRLEQEIVQLKATIATQTSILEDNGWLPT